MYWTGKSPNFFIYNNHQRISKSWSTIHQVEGLEKDHTVGGIQLGSADDMAANRTCYQESSIIRGGWM